MITRREALRGMAAGALAGAAGPVLAQDDRSTITVYVGAQASMDFTARLISDRLRDALGRPAITMSRLGAGQRLALGEARRAAPDGRTLVFATSGPFAIYPHIYTKLDYDPDRDFTAIVGVSQFDVAIATGPMTGDTVDGLPGARDIRTLLDWVRKQPPPTMFASAPGNGSFSHFVGIATAMATRLDLVHVPYKDSGAAMLDCASGRIPIVITGLTALLPMHRQGRIRVVAVSGPVRSPLLPEVPTLAEAGVAVSRATTTGLFGPAGLAPATVTQLHDAIRPMLVDPKIVAQLEQRGVTMRPSTGAELTAAILDEREYFRKIARDSGYVPEPG